MGFSVFKMSVFGMGANIHSYYELTLGAFLCTVTSISVHTNGFLL